MRGPQGPKSSHGDPQHPTRLHGDRRYHRRSGIQTAQMQSKQPL